MSAVGLIGGDDWIKKLLRNFKHWIWTVVEKLWVLETWGNFFLKDSVIVLFNMPLPILG